MDTLKHDIDREIEATLKNNGASDDWKRGFRDGAETAEEVARDWFKEAVG